MAKPIPVTVFGVEYPSRSQACVAFNHRPAKIDHRIRAGASLEDALKGENRYTGAKKHPSYGSWNGMRSRCYSKSACSLRYKGRVEVCERWMDDFWAFVEDMGEPPGPGYSIDRKNNSKGYYKDNCRWATRKQQQRNTRSNVVIDAYGFKLTAIEWGEKTGIPGDLISLRIRKGMNEVEAITKAVRSNSRSRYKPTEFLLKIQGVENE